jgi:succinyl-CoA synthetase alpha subunit
MGKAAAGFFPVEFNLPGRVGVVSRSGTLSYGAVAALQRRGIGQSTVVGVGGSVFRGLDFADCLALFEADDDTDVVVLLGEIGGRDEHRAAEFLRRGFTKPVVALLVGQSAPPGVVMGHAGAIVTDESEGSSSKAQALAAAGATVVTSLDELTDVVDRLVPDPDPNPPPKEPRRTS